MPSNPSRLIIVFVLLGILFLPFEVFAEEPQQELSASGAILEELRRLEEENNLWKARREETSGFWANMMNALKERESFRKQHLLRREKRTELRRSCRSDVRRSNRDSKLPTMFRCYRATLSLDLEDLRKEKALLADSKALGTHSELSDAISTIIAAIDVGIYETEEGLMEAKTNLAKKYRVPHFLAVSRAKLNYIQLWSLQMMVRIRDIQEECSPGSEKAYKCPDSPLQEGFDQELSDVITCYESARDSVDPLLILENNQDLISGLRQVHSDLNICREKLRDTWKKNATATLEAEAEAEEAQ